MDHSKTIKQFWDNVDKGTEDECWLWTAPLNKEGYGHLYCSISKRSYVAHRLSYEIMHGVEPKGFIVCHGCHVRNCVNPHHLMLGTTQDNVDDLTAKNMGFLAKGEAHPRSKLTVERVRYIRKVFANEYNWYTCRMIGEEWGVNPSTIRSVALGKTWKHVR